MIVAVITIWMMQVPVYQVVDVVSVGHGFVTTICAVLVFLRVSGAVVPIRAVCRIGRTDFNRVFINMTIMRMMQVSVMQIIEVIVVPDCSMLAPVVVFVCVLFVDLMFGHLGSFLSGEDAHGAWMWAGNRG